MPLNYPTLAANVPGQYSHFFAQDGCPFQVFYVDFVQIWKRITKCHGRHYQFFAGVLVPSQENLLFDGSMGFVLQLLG